MSAVVPALHGLEFQSKELYFDGMKSIVSEKGQITIPKALRDRLGLNPGMVLDFEADHGRLVGRKRLPADPFQKWRGQGRLPADHSVDQYLKVARGDHRR